MIDLINSELDSHQNVLKSVKENLTNHIYTASILINETINQGNKIFVFGNGNNILTTQYLVHKCHLNEKVNVFSLVQEPSIFTNIANNDGYDFIFSKQIENLASKDDLLIGISSSGNSKNVLRALSLGKNLGCKSIGLSGYDGGAMSEFCDLNLVIPSDNISNIEELHMMICNIISR